MTTYRMKLAKLKPDTQYVNLPFSMFYDTGEDFRLGDPILWDTVGDNVHYGTLFAYLFRRFGYPNTGWDDYKELAKYWLTTPSEDMVLQVVPYVGETSAITFRFLVPFDVLRGLEDYCRRKHTQWNARMLDWYEANHEMPEWMDEFVYALAESEWFDEESPSWRDTLRFIPILAQGENKDKACAWLESVRTAYREIEPEPKTFENKPLNWKDWPDDDPLKPYASSAYEALNNLKKPVGVRDHRINAFQANDKSFVRDIKPASVSGYPSGAIGNEAPAEFAEIHSLIVELGKGNAKRGIRKLHQMVSTKL